ncbi:MAG: universal stress protein, partial [Myxococcota bacterium]
MNILVAVDLAHEPERVVERALPWAARIAGRIHLRMVSPMTWESRDVFGGTESEALAEEWESRSQAEADALDRLATSVPAHMAGPHAVMRGPVVPTLLKAAESFDLVFVGTHGRRGLAKAFLGSVAERVVRSASVPVLVLPLASTPVAADGPLRVVVPVDAREPNLDAARRVRDWLGDAAQLHLVYALVDLGLSR